MIEEMMKLMGKMSGEGRSKMMSNIVQGCCSKIDKKQQENMLSMCQPMFEKTDRQFSTQKTKG